MTVDRLGGGGGRSLIERRRFIWALGSGALAVGVLGVAACGEQSGGATSTLRVTSPASGAGTVASTTTTRPGTTNGAVDASAPLSWVEASFVFVSAYILERGGRACIVDTGVAQSEATLEEALAGLDLGWDAVDHIVLTHHHRDHTGSLGAAADLAGGATLYGGEADIASIDAPREMVAVGDGSEVMGLQVIETPGHTAGSISLFDAGTGVLIVGDALTGGGGSTVSGSNPQFTDDVEMARASVVKLAALSFETILVGHGEPVLTEGSEVLAAYAATLDG
ncbi:MAG: MBL fold metallo-hydrolase [Acidimicrobiia bacterium]|nr:MBL fold metallo-hydrolase [Acidimicrobiia bacterium]